MALAKVCVTDGTPQEFQSPRLIMCIGAAHVDQLYRAHAALQLQLIAREHHADGTADPHAINQRKMFRDLRRLVRQRA